jgi:hypothetical protein
VVLFLLLESNGISYAPPTAQPYKKDKIKQIVKTKKAKY